MRGTLDGEEAEYRGIAAESLGTLAGSSTIRPTRLSFSLSERRVRGRPPREEQTKDAWQSWPRLKFRTKVAQTSHNLLESHYSCLSRRMLAAFGRAPALEDHEILHTPLIHLASTPLTLTRSHSTSSLSTCVERTKFPKKPKK